MCATGSALALVWADTSFLGYQRSGGEAAYLFQPHTNYRTLDFDKAFSTRMVQKIVKWWADYSRLGDLSPHDLRRTAITRALESGLSYRNFWAYDDE